MKFHHFWRDLFSLFFEIAFLKIVAACELNIPTREKSTRKVTETI